MNRYKAHAAECFRLAQTAASREQKAILIGLAREWEVMAQQMDESTGQQPNDGAIEKSA